MSDVLFHRLRVREVVTETDDSRSLVFDLTPSQVERFHYRPGQFLTLRVPGQDGAVARCYSLSSSPEVDHHPKVTVKRVDGGYGSNWICDHVAAGSEIDVLEPAGVFTPRSFEEDLLLFAGGSGITPIMSIVKSSLAAGSSRAVLVYANRDEDSVIFSEELNRLAAEHPDRLVVIHWLESVQGLPSIEALHALVQPYDYSQAFLCGPRPFMQAARKALREKDFPRTGLHLERFASLAGDPFEEARPADPNRHDHELRVDAAQRLGRAQ